MRLSPSAALRMLAADRAALECSRDFIRAKWWLLQGDPASALPLLKRVVNQGDRRRRNTPESYEAWALLGQIWSAADEWDQAASAYEQASLLQPRSAAYKLLAARAWANAGRYDMAIRYCEQALAINNASEIWLLLAETRFQQQIRLPKSQRDWQPFRKAFVEAAAAAEKKSLPEPWRLKLLQAGALLAGAMEKSVRRSARRGRRTAARRRKRISHVRRAAAIAAPGLRARRLPGGCRSRSGESRQAPRPGSPGLALPGSVVHVAEAICGGPRQS